MSNEIYRMANFGIFVLKSLEKQNKEFVVRKKPFNYFYLAIVRLKSLQFTRPVIVATCTKHIFSLCNLVNTWTNPTVILWSFKLSCTPKLVSHFKCLGPQSRENIFT